MDYKAESGRRLRRAREDAGLTLRELSERTRHLSISRISNYEQGLRYMDPEAAIDLGRALGVRPAWLMCVDNDDALSGEERALLIRYQLTDDRGKQAIKAIAESQPIVYRPDQDPPSIPMFPSQVA